MGPGNTSEAFVVDPVSQAAIIAAVVITGVSIYREVAGFGALHGKRVLGRNRGGHGWDGKVYR